MRSRRPVPSSRSTPTPSFARSQGREGMWWGWQGGGLKGHRLKCHPRDAPGACGQPLPAFGLACCQCCLQERSHLGFITPPLTALQQERVQRHLHHWNLHDPTESSHVGNHSAWSHRSRKFTSLCPFHSCMTCLCTTEAVLHHISDNNQALLNVSERREGWGRG